MTDFSRILVVVACVLSSPVSAGQVQDWGDSGRWNIRVDPDAGNGCFMETELEGGTVVEFGLVPNRSGGFFAIYNSDWTDIAVGDEGTVTLEFDAKQFSGTGTGAERDGVPGGYAFFNNPNVRDEFSRSTTMIIFGGEGRTVSVDLTGTSKAMQAVEACQTKQTN